MAIPYVRQTWTDGSGGGTPVSAARLGVLEQGVYDAHRMPAARVYNNANISLTNSTNTALTFNTERFDTDTIHDLVTNTGRLTCKTAGVYHIIGQVEFAPNATGLRQLQIRVNGTTTIDGVILNQMGAGTQVIAKVDTLYQLAVNDYVELMAFQSSGGALNVTSVANTSPEFMMVRVST